MYLFKLWFFPVLHNAQKDLHSTMYLFKRRFPLMSRDWKIYLHSTMYLFKPFHPTQKPIRLYEIYIPPCIYLNEFDRRVGKALETSIYIPPCIYLNPLRYAGKIRIIIIYIPPCIYLNLVCLYRGYAGEEDLHSTMYLFKPIASLLTRSSMIWFTFHHVSI